VVRVFEAVGAIKQSLNPLVVAHDLGQAAVVGCAFALNHSTKRVIYLTAVYVAGVHRHGLLESCVGSVPRVGYGTALTTT
jgi:hypothetical protein